MQIEKSNVNLKPLFHWGGKFEIFDRFGMKLQDVYIRLVGDAELNRSRVLAIKKSTELRKKLKTQDSDERIVFIQEIPEDKETLIGMISYFKVKELTQQANREIKPTLPKEPKSDALLEEFEKYQEEVDTYAEKRMQQINDYVQENLTGIMKQLDKEDIPWLKKEYERLLINELCEQEMIVKFRESCTYFGSFKDENFKESLFESFDEFDNLPKDIKDQFIEHYAGLEINIDELKKSLEATP